MRNPLQVIVQAFLILSPLLYACSGGTDGGNGGTCDNGVVEPGDQCDNQVTDSTTCSTLGFADGNLDCDNDCQFDTMGCTRLATCGNGTLDTLELCEGFELRDATCESHGFDGGSLTCTGDCTIDTSDCVEDANTSCSGVVPEATGEFFLALDTSLAPGALLLFIATVLVDSSLVPATFTMSLQPLCTQSDQCAVNQPIGDAHAVSAIDLDQQCAFSMDISALDIPGGANTISGSDATAELTVSGDVQNGDFFCGSVGGTIAVGGAAIPVDGSTFGSSRIAPGTLGSDLPTPVYTCP